MLVAFVLIFLAWLTTDMNGELIGLGTRSTRVVWFLWVTSCVSAFLAMMCDRATRVVAIAVLLCLFVLFFPPLP
jgi:hypothetical protein